MKPTEDQVLEALRLGPSTNAKIRDWLGISVLDETGMATGRVLQRLKRQGKVFSQDGRWHLTKHKTCHLCLGRGWLDA